MPRKKQGEGGGAKGPDADANAGGAGADTKPLVKKILVYMSTSTHRLVDPARAALVELRGALETALKESRHDFFSATGNRRIEAHVLVHGYQVDTGLNVGATEFTYTVGKDGFQWSWPDAEGLKYIPGDTSVLKTWINSKMYPREASETLDSTVLVIWGHGQGVGTDLRLPQPAQDAAGSSGVTRPSFLNIGGFSDQRMARAVEDGLRPTESASINPVDLLIFDSCLMAGVELAYEFRHAARYLIASQSFVYTAPGGPPGLSLGAVTRGFVQRGAWRAEGSAHAAGSTRLLEAGTDIVSVIGDRRSGAQHLTLFKLEGLGLEELESVVNAPTPSPTDVWLKAVEKSPANTAFHAGELAKLIKPTLPEQPGGQPGAPRVQIAGLMKLFTFMLKDASANAGERERILFAFRRASFARARQFVDLQDLARQVHAFSRHELLQVVALALLNQLEPRFDGFVVYHRAAVPFRDKPRFSGLSVYCPWFAAPVVPVTSGDEPVWDVLVDHDQYRALALNEDSKWSDFVLGSLYATTTAPERKPSRAASSHDPRDRPGCGGHGRGGRACCCGPWPRVPYPYPHGPSGSQSWAEAQSGEVMGDKQSNPANGPLEDDD